MQGFAEADLVFEHTFNAQLMHQAYIEPHACVVSAQPPLNSPSQEENTSLVSPPQEENASLHSPLRGGIQGG